MKEAFIDGLYKNSVSQARRDMVLQGLDSVLVELCDVIVDPLRDKVVSAHIAALTSRFYA